MCQIFAAELQEETFEAQWSGTKKPSKPGVPHQAYFSVLPGGKNAQKKTSRKAHISTIPLKIMLAKRASSHTPFKGKSTLFSHS